MRTPRIFSLVSAPLGLALLLAPLPACAATSLPLANPGFEQGELGQAPPEWTVSEADRKEGYSAKTVDEKPVEGARCALLHRVSERSMDDTYGELVQSLNAAPLRGKRIRFRAQVRIEPTPLGPRARLLIGFDRAGQSPGVGGDFRSEVVNQPVWKTLEVLAEVPPDAARLRLVMGVLGDAKAWLDGATLEVIGEAGAGNEPARPLADRGLANLVAFTHLYGYVRFFHPSDGAAQADWNALALAGVQQVEKAEGPKELARTLEDFFRPLAPTVRVYPSADPRPLLAPALRPAPGEALEILSWQHAGVDLSGGTSGNVYSSRRVARPIAGTQSSPDTPLLADLGAGVSASIPLALYKDGQGTLPHGAPAAPPKPDKPEGFISTGNDRATRLADVVVAWNVFQHFYPYFDVVKTDWPAELERALRGAATDRDGDAFTLTLRHLVAALHDGHGNAFGPHIAEDHRPPILWDWVEGALVVTDVSPQGAEGVVRGDLVARIDGRPAAQALAEEESLSSGATPQWIRFRALASLLAGPQDRDLRLELRHADGTLSEVVLHRTISLDSITSSVEPRPEKLAEIQPGIFYLDVDRLDDGDVKAALERLAKAKGIVIDFRGYPGSLSTILIAHLIDQPVKSAQWHVPRISRPDRVGMEFDSSDWSVQPEAPRFSAKVAFLMDGQAISYAETYLGIVEHYKLAALVGSPTAGTNGNINPFTLPGGYRFVWTGMQVLKHDGSRHHGVGIQPTVAVSRTLAGVAAGRDEVLEKGIEVVSQ